MTEDRALLLKSGAKRWASVYPRVSASSNDEAPPCPPWERLVGIVHSALYTYSWRHCVRSITNKNHPLLGRNPSLPSRHLIESKDLSDCAACRLVQSVLTARELGCLVELFRRELVPAPAKPTWVGIVLLAFGTFLPCRCRGQPTLLFHDP